MNRLSQTGLPEVSQARRQFLASGSAAAAAFAMGRPLLAADATKDQPTAFFLIGDTHYLAEKESPAHLDERSAAVTRGLIDTLNRLPGEKIPAEAGGGTVAAPQGVIHAGDVIDTGDKSGPVHEKMQQTEWDAFAGDFGISGDKRLKYPVYEVHGNHDSPRGKGLAIDGIIERNRRRPGVKSTSASGLHYAWDWGRVRMINLGIVVGSAKGAVQTRRYNPTDSLDFLIGDLQRQVGDSRRPVVLTHHIDVARYSGACDETTPANLSKEWHPCDVRAYYEAIRKYNIVAILYGHTHARAVLRWDGQSGKAEKGLSLFNVDNSSHFNGKQQAFFYFEIGAGELVVREVATPDAWATYGWTPQVWRLPIPA